MSAGVLPGLETYKVDKVQYGKAAKTTDFPVSDRVLEAFRNFVRTQPDFNLLPTQHDEEHDIKKQRHRQEIKNPSINKQSGARVLLDRDQQVLRAIDALPDAKRLADNARNSVWRG